MRKKCQWSEIDTWVCAFLFFCPLQSSSTDTQILLAASSNNAFSLCSCFLFLLKRIFKKPSTSKNMYHDPKLALSFSFSWKGCERWGRWETSPLVSILCSSEDVVSYDSELSCPARPIIYTHTCRFSSNIFQSIAISLNSSHPLFRKKAINYLSHLYNKCKLPTTNIASRSQIGILLKQKRFWALILLI